MALFDTGSDLHLMIAKQYIKLGLSALTGPEIAYKDIRSNAITMIDSFANEV